MTTEESFIILRPLGVAPASEKAGFLVRLICYKNLKGVLRG